MLCIDEQWLLRKICCQHLHQARMHSFPISFCPDHWLGNEEMHAWQQRHQVAEGNNPSGLRLCVWPCLTLALLWQPEETDRWIRKDSWHSSLTHQKTKLMNMNAGEETAKLNGEGLENVEEFTYLGSSVNRWQHREWSVNQKSKGCCSIPFSEQHLEKNKTLTEKRIWAFSGIMPSWP